MGKLSGQYGYVGVSAIIAGINQWSLDHTVEMLETTDFGASGVATYVPGVSRWSGTFSGYKDGAPVALGDSATVTLEFGETTGSVILWRGGGYISGVHPTTNFDGVVGYAYDFQGDGVLTPPVT